jgi:hypothetical protein
MVNAGSWVYDRQFVGEVPNESPYWPGVCVVLSDDGGAPELRRLLGYRGRADLEPEPEPQAEPRGTQAGQATPGVKQTA